MIDIQSATTEITQGRKERGKNKKKKGSNYRAKISWPVQALFHRAAINMDNDL